MSLSAALAGYWEEIEFDLRKMGVRLTDFFRGKISPRELVSLIRFLPADSMFVRKAAPDTAQIASWTQTDYLLADLFDVYARVHFENPKPYPRPGDAIREREAQERRRAQLEAQLQRQRAREQERRLRAV